MRPKEFQEKTLDTISEFHSELKKQQGIVKQILSAVGESASEDDRDYTARAWAEFGRRGMLPRVPDRHGAVLPPPYVRRKDSQGQIVPHICLKVPTGGGKTLLGVAALERLQVQTGLVLWIMPSRAIFKQTKRAFATRVHPYRQWLERASGGQVKLLQKKREFSRSDMENYLCVMPLMLQAADHKKGNFLRIFRDTGKFPDLFPSSEDKQANDEFLREHPDLEVNDLSEGLPGAVKHSLFNALKIARPVIVLDEAHNAYTENRRKRLCEFNPRFMLELSATPQLGVSNILVDVTGAALKREQMIKLPLRIHNFEKTGWQYTLSKAKEQRDRLESEARKLQGESGRYIRPIVLIRVERVGTDQRDGQCVHAEDVRDYLMTQLKIPESHIRRKTAVRDEIADEDLLSPYSTVRYILTKDALREGWDCPFAYVLALLDSTTAPRALTQMTGRILRQPDAELTGKAALDQSYIYCYDRNVGEAIAQVKRGLEYEGMGDLAEFVQDGADAGSPASGQLQVIRRRRQFRDAQIFLPNVLHREGTKYRQLDYHSDVLGAVNWGKIAAAPADIDFAAMDEIRETILSVDLPGFGLAPVSADIPLDASLEMDFFVRHLYEALPNPFLAAQAAQNMIHSLRDAYNAKQIIERRYHLSEMLRQRLAELAEHEARAVFCQKLESQDIRFELIADESGFEFAHELQKIVEQGQRPLITQSGGLSEKSLYEKVYEKEFNGLEKDFAISLDGHSAVTWWHRFAVRREYGLQGWRRNRVYPDFVVCVSKEKGDSRRVFVLETKGLQLAGNLDTEYKQKLFETLEIAEPHAVEYGALTLPRKGGKRHSMSLRLLFEDSYRTEFERLVQQ